MNQFMNANFMLYNDCAQQLYHEYAKNLPIIDYHCHIDPQQILVNSSFSNLTQLWLAGDHYKWRAMRSCGVEEKYITGNATDYDKFLAWATIIPQLIGNPLYHWTHLELQRYFNIMQPLNADSAPFIWQQANQLLLKGELTVNVILQRSQVELICTTDDPCDSLFAHQQLVNSSCPSKVLPSFRPDRALDISNHDYVKWLTKLSQITHLSIKTYSDLLQALEQRLDYFQLIGCKVADHGLNYIPFAPCTDSQAENIFAQALAKQPLTELAENQFCAHLLIWLAKQYAKRDWSMQLHCNVLRNLNQQKYLELGADRGFDSINDSLIAKPLAQLLNAMNQQQLPRTILYSLNPRDNYTLATIMGSFQTSEAKGKLQLGAAWWFNDQRDGIEEHLRSLANLGALGTFVGMLTDSRSFLSYTRHEYFRRILCNLIGSWVEKGEYPADLNNLHQLISNLCYYNTKTYFKFGD
jgi:glucuronate isomerase